MKSRKLEKVNLARHIIMAYPFATCLIVGIWVVCLMPVPETPLANISLFDKWVHMALYAFLSITLWAEYLRRHKELNKKHLFIGVFMAPLLMGGLIELAQATCTGGNRSGDWLDFAANTIGVVVGNVIGMLLAKCFAKGKKGK